MYKFLILQIFVIHSRSNTYANFGYSYAMATHNSYTNTLDG